jgi:hypothetical protein
VARPCAGLWLGDDFVPDGLSSRNRPVQLVSMDGRPPWVGLGRAMGLSTYPKNSQQVILSLSKGGWRLRKAAPFDELSLLNRSCG